MTSRIPTLVFITVAAAGALLSFFIVGPFNNIDSQIYLSQVEQFETRSLLLEPHDVALRAFKPLYGVVGALMSPPLSHIEALQLFNLALYFGLPFVSFLFLLELGFQRRAALWGALWITTGYPLLKYGLAVSTDMGGWFFAVLSVYLILRAIRTDSLRMLVVASCVGFIGAAAKEPGVLGLLFGGLYILFTYNQRPFKRTLTYIAALALPAFFLEVLLFTILIYAGFPTFLDWYGVVLQDDFVERHFKIFNLIGVVGSTFNILLPFALIGAYAVIRKRAHIQFPYQKLIALLIASLPVLLWTIFISRILYIQFLVVVPLALIGIAEVLGYVPLRFKKQAEYILYVLPIVVGVLLLLVAGRGSLFTILFS